MIRGITIVQENHSANVAEKSTSASKCKPTRRLMRQYTSSMNPMVAACTERKRTVCRVLRAKHARAVATTDIAKLTRTIMSMGYPAKTAINTTIIAPTIKDEIAAKYLCCISKRSSFAQKLENFVDNAL